MTRPDDMPFPGAWDEYDAASGLNHLRWNPDTDIVPAAQGAVTRAPGFYQVWDPCLQGFVTRPARTLPLTTRPRLSRDIRLPHNTNGRPIEDVTLPTWDEDDADGSTPPSMDPQAYAALDAHLNDTRYRNTAGYLINNNHDYLHHDKENPMSITPGELRGRLQPTILLRMTAAVQSAPGNTDTDGMVFGPGVVVFAQYIGNGRLILTPLDTSYVHGSHVVMASALNTTAEIIKNAELANAFMHHRNPTAADPR